MCSRHPLRRPRGRHRLQRKVGTGIELPFVVYAESYSCGVIARLLHRADISTVQAFSWPTAPAGRCPCVRD